MQIVRLWLALTFGLAMAGPEAHACPVHDGHHAAAPVQHHHAGSPDDGSDADPLCTCPQCGPLGGGVAVLPAAPRASLLPARPVGAHAHQPVLVVLPGAPDYLLPFALAPPRALV